jgi:hypothetical protein
MYGKKQSVNKRVHTVFGGVVLFDARGNYLVVCIAVHIPQFEIVFRLRCHPFRVARELFSDAFFECSPLPASHFCICVSDYPDKARAFTPPL